MVSYVIRYGTRCYVARGLIRVGVENASGPAGLDSNRCRNDGGGSDQAYGSVGLFLLLKLVEVRHFGHVGER